MKKKVLFAVVVLLAGLSQGVKAQNFQHFEVAPSGQTLYYYIGVDYSNYEDIAIVVHPLAGNVTDYTTSRWGTYAMPTGDLVIPDTVHYNGMDIPVRGIERHAFMNCHGLTSVVIPNTVKVIGKFAFYFCDSLTSVTLPNTLSEIRNTYIDFDSHTIGEFTFSGCTQLSGNITIPTGVTTIENHAFAGTNISSITWPTTVTTIGGLAFSGCNNLGTVTIPNSVTTIEGGAFYNCYKVLSIDVPATVEFTDYSYGWMNYPASTTFQLVKNINYTGSLIDTNNSLGVGAWGARTLNGYIENGYVYSDPNKTKLTACNYEQTSFAIPASVDTIGETAFLWHSDLTQITLPEGLEVIGASAFNSCTGLTQVDFPSTLADIGYGAFSYCTGLTDITLPAALTNLGTSTFNGCENLDTLRMLASVPPMYDTRDGWNLNATTGDTIWYYDSSLVNVPILVPCNSGSAYRHATGWSACNNIIDTCAGEIETFTVTVLSADTVMGTVSGGGEVEDGETVTIRAIANAGYRFVRWNDNDTHAVRTVTVTADVTYTAYFEALQGIDEIETSRVNIEVSGLAVTVENPDGETVQIYDIAGRMLTSSKLSIFNFQFSTSGVYIVKVAGLPAWKIVVVR